MTKRIISDLIKTAEDKYVSLAESNGGTWLRSVLVSLDVSLSPEGSLTVSTGQAIERFLFTQADLISQKRLAESLTVLRSELTKVKQSQDYLDRDIEQLSKLVLRFVSAVGYQEKEELRVAYARQLAHFFDVTYMTEHNKIFYQQLLMRLTIDHLYILQFSQEYLTDDKGKIHEKSLTLQKSIIDKFIARGLDEAIVFGFIKDLDSMGLMNETQMSVIGGDMHHLYITDLGRKILSQIIS